MVDISRHLKLDAKMIQVITFDQTTHTLNAIQRFDSSIPPTLPSPSHLGPKLLYWFSGRQGFLFHSSAIYVLGF